MKTTDLQTAKILAKLLDGYADEMKFLSRGRNPAETISKIQALSINVVLNDVRKIFENKIGNRYLNIIDAEKPISIVDTQLILKPYRVLLAHYINSKPITVKKKV